METLAIIAYKQPVTKGEIESIRGVNSDYSVQKLLEKELIVISGRSEDLPGKPLLYITSRTFMDYFGINDVSICQKSKKYLRAQRTAPTVVNEEAGEVVDTAVLLVDHEGNLISDAVNPGSEERTENNSAT